MAPRTRSPKGLLLFAAVLPLFGCGKSSQPQTREVSLAPHVAAPVDPALIAPANRHSDPDLYSQWGDDGLARVNKLRKWAAENVARNPACGKVADLDLVRDGDGSISEPFRVYVDCDPVRRFHVSEDDVGQPVMTDQARGLALRGSVTQQCLETVRKHLSFPSTMNVNMLLISAQESEDTGNWTVNFDFSSKNGLGNSIPQRAFCTVSVDGDAEASIENR